MSSVELREIKELIRSLANELKTEISHNRDSIHDAAVQVTEYHCDLRNHVTLCEIRHRQVDPVVEQARSTAHDNKRDLMIVKWVGCLFVSAFIIRLVADIWNLVAIK